MITVTIEWEDIPLECELEYEPADPSVGYECAEYNLYECYLPNGSDFTCRLTQKTIEEIEALAIKTLKQDSDESRAERDYYSKAEGF